MPGRGRCGQEMEEFRENTQKKLWDFPPALAPLIGTRDRASLHRFEPGFLCKSSEWYSHVDMS